MRILFCLECLFWLVRLANLCCRDLLSLLWLYFTRFCCNPCYWSGPSLSLLAAQWANVNTITAMRMLGFQNHLKWSFSMLPNAMIGFYPRNHTLGKKWDRPILNSALIKILGTSGLWFPWPGLTEVKFSEAQKCLGLHIPINWCMRLSI